jgi:hypothetical protein
VKRIILQRNIKTITDCEFVDDTNLYLKESRKNLKYVKIILDTFASAMGANINWHKSNAMWSSTSQRDWDRGEDVNFMWIEKGEMTRYLDFMIGFCTTPETRFKVVLASL